MADCNVTIEEAVCMCKAVRRCRDPVGRQQVQPNAPGPRPVRRGSGSDCAMQATSEAFLEMTISGILVTLGRGKSIPSLRSRQRQVHSLLQGARCYCKKARQMLYSDHMQKGIQGGDDMKWH